MVSQKMKSESKPMSDKPKKIELAPEILEAVRNNPDSIYAERVRLYLELRQQKARILSAFEGTILYPIARWWLNHD